MTSREIRRSFLDYFQTAQHRLVSSAPLVPGDDPTLLFTNAGMNQFKDVFLGRERRDYRRATTAQKCMRVSGKHNDLDNVGPSHRHHTFFEMLGNFSFGDYFKAEAIPFAWTLLTDVWHLPPERLYATIFEGDAAVPRDDEAFALWQRFLPDERIGALGADDNFWQMGDTGPCGRCSEIYYVRDDGTMLEIWNNVFMEFDRQAGGVLTPLPAPSIDTGMGLERITAIMHGVESNYDTDLFTPILRAIGEISGHGYGGDDPSSVSMRVVADHVRAMTFLIADGVVPSNEWRGYVLRKIMRRAMRHGKKLGVMRPFLHDLATVVITEMHEAYPELQTNRDAVVRVIRAEEERFDVVLSSGLSRLEDVLDRAAASGSRTVPGDEVFRLYDSLGLPLDFIEDLAGERQLAVDREGYDAAMQGQRERARASSAFDIKEQQAFGFQSDAAREQVERLPDAFEGYTATDVAASRVAAVFDATRQQVSALAEGTSGFVVLDRTPFYVAAGGQVSDTGALESTGGDAVRAEVSGMSRLGPSGPRLHHVSVQSGSLRPGATVRATVDDQQRRAIRRNHTATHLLHAALRQTLGPHVKQAGSLVAPDRLRFDFLHFSPISREELGTIEQIVNAQIMRNVPVDTTERGIDDAKALGAMALFGEKYGDRVRVVDIPGFSLELCGGTHCAATGDIGPFTIVSEGGVAAGVRRIEAVTGLAALERAQEDRRQLSALSDELKVAPGQASEAVAKLQGDVKRLQKELHEAKMRSAVGTPATTDAPLLVKDIPLQVRRVDGLDRAGLRELADQLKQQLGSGVVVLAAQADGKVALVVAVTKDLTSRVKAGDMVKRLAPVVGGTGGGRPDFAEAGGKSPDHIDAMLAEAGPALEALL